MPETITITREQYLSMSPDAYLSGGFRDAAGGLRPEVDAIWATAGAVQLEAISPRVLATAVEALNQVLPLHAGAPAARYRTACEEAAEVTAGALGRPVPPELIAWLARFEPHLHTERDLFDLQHLLASVGRMHALYQGMRRGRAPC